MKKELGSKKLEPTQEQIIDCNEVIRIARLAIAYDSDCDSIYNLYKKYIDKDASYPNKSCNGCGQSVQKYREKLLGLGKDPKNYIKL